MGKKPTSTRRARGKQVVRDLSARGTMARESRGGVEKVVIVQEPLVRQGSWQGKSADRFFDY